MQEREGYQRVSFTRVKWDEPKEVEGMLVEKLTVLIRGTTIGKYVLRDENGQKLVVMGTTILDQYLRDIPLGTHILMSYTGETNTLGGMKVKEFDVFTKGELGEILAELDEHQAF